MGGVGLGVSERAPEVTEEVADGGEGGEDGGGEFHGAGA